LVKHLYKNYIKHNHTLIYLDVSISIRDLRQKKTCSVLLPVFATVAMRRGKKSLESLEVIKDRLDSDKTWRKQTLLEADDVMKLLEFILTTTYFNFRGFPLVANLYMKHLKRKILVTAPVELKPRLWKRYGDDILEVVKKTSVDEMTDFFNNLINSGSIKFAYETESEGKLRFWIF